MTRPPNKRVSRGKPVRTAGGGKKDGCPMLLAFPFAMIAVGVLGLVTHLWFPVLLLAALPTRQWRLAALDSTNVPPVTPARRHRRLRYAPAGAAVSGRARQPHQAPAVAAQGWTSTAG